MLCHSCIEGRWSMALSYCALSRRPWPSRPTAPLSHCPGCFTVPFSMSHGPIVRVSIVQASMVPLTIVPRPHCPIVALSIVHCRIVYCPSIPLPHRLIAALSSALLPRYPWALHCPSVPLWLCASIHCPILRLFIVPLSYCPIVLLLVFPTVLCPSVTLSMVPFSCCPIVTLSYCFMLVLLLLL
jgi:hypothetical protein